MSDESKVYIVHFEDDDWIQKQDRLTWSDVPFLVLLSLLPFGIVLGAIVMAAQGK